MTKSTAFRARSIPIKELIFYRQTLKFGHQCQNQLDNCTWHAVWQYHQRNLRNAAMHNETCRDNSYNLVNLWHQFLFLCKRMKDKRSVSYTLGLIKSPAKKIYKGMKIITHKKSQIIPSPVDTAQVHNTPPQFTIKITVSLCR